MSLTDQQERFVAEYLIDLNGTQAAIRAGYSRKTAESQASRLLRNDKVQAALREAMARRSKRTELTQDQVLRELARIAFFDIRKAVRWGATPAQPETDEFAPNGVNLYPVALVPSENLDDDTAAAITEVSLTTNGVKIKMGDKRSALETLLRHLGGLPEADEAVPVDWTVRPPVGDVRVTRH